MGSNETFHIAIEHGRVTKLLQVPELVIRCVELPDPDEVETWLGRYRLQGRIVNETRKKLTSVKYDVSYYDNNGRFLGLDRAGIVDDDEIDANDFLAIDLELAIPPEVSRCVFNCRALVAGWFGKLFWG